MNWIRNQWENTPLKLILIISSVLLFVAVVFSKGFGMHDDHFIVIEVAQSWADGLDYNNWLPWNNSQAMPTGHSFFYVGLHFLFFKAMNFIGFTDPQGKMYIIRFIHALLSLITIIYGYKIVLKLSDLKSARLAGLLLAAFWFVPFLSVRNLIEIVCVPFLVLGVWRTISGNEEQSRSKIFYWIITGFIMGIAVNIRLQSILFIGGFVLALLILKKWKTAIFISAGVAITLIMIQGITDTFMWGYPFAEFIEYVRYCFGCAEEYMVMEWYTYIILLLGILIPPISIFLFFGFFRVWKKHLLIFLPVLIFIAFHSYFPNKQERFIFPVIPFLIMLGIIGWQDFKNKSKFWDNHKTLLKGCWIFFWTLNLIALPVVSTAYSKRSRVEAMVYLSKLSDIQNFIIEDSNRDGIKPLPLYYCKQWAHPINMSSDITPDKLKEILKNTDYTNYPNYVLFCGNKKLDERVQSFKSVFPNIKSITTIDPGFIDNLLYKMNPVNLNQQIFIYKIKHSQKDVERIKLDYDSLIQK